MKIIASTIALVILIVAANACAAGESGTPATPQPDVRPTTATLAPIATLTTPVSTVTTASPTPTQAATIPSNTPYSTPQSSSTATPAQVSITPAPAATGTATPPTPTPQITTTGSGFVLVAEPTATPGPTPTLKPTPTPTPIPSYYSSQFTEQDYAEIAKQLPQPPRLPNDTWPPQTGDQTPEGIKGSAAYEIARKFGRKPFDDFVRPAINEYYGKYTRLDPASSATRDMQYEIMHPKLPVFRYVWEGAVKTEDGYDFWRLSAYFKVEDGPPEPAYPNQTSYKVTLLDGRIHGGIIDDCQALLAGDYPADC